MKRITKKYLTIASLLIGLYSCQKNEIVSAPAKIEPVSELKYSLSGDTVLLSWQLPKGTDSLYPTVNNGSASTLQGLRMLTYKYGVVETNKEYAFTVKLTDQKGNYSLGQTVRFTREGAAPVKNLVGLQNDNGVLISWSLPDKPITKITIKLGTQTVDLAPTATSYQFNNVAAGAYLVSAVTMNSSNQISNTVFLPFKVGATAVAFLGVYTDSTTLLATGDDDEIAAAKWFFSNYNKSRYISFSQIKNGSIDLTQYRVIWWIYDSQSGSPALPAISTDAAVLTNLKNYYKNGGNFLFSMHAIRYNWELGRMTEAQKLVVGAGTGGNNPDVWGVGVKIGSHDQRNHPLYAGISITTPNGGFPVIGPGWKEDHNYVMVEVPAFYSLGNGDEAAYTKFTTNNNLEWLGVWDGIGDYFMAGIFELKPKDSFLGTSLNIGIGGVEWNQNNTTNPYQTNIQKLYKNAIDYLKTK